MSSEKLQGQYIAALSRIGARSSGASKRQIPIFQRGPEADEKQALHDAARALSALWKINQSTKR